MKKVWLSTLLTCSLVVFTYHHSLADEETPATSEFSNPAQAAHAANLAEEVAATDTATIEAAQNVQVAENEVKELEEALKAADPNNIAAMKIAEDDLTKAESTLNKAETDLAGLVGVTETAISEMRGNGMGWGQIAHELNVHPGVLGLGHMKSYGANLATGFPDDFEMDEATKRDVKHGWAKGHGMSTSVASSSRKGLGLAETDLGIGGKGANSSHGNMGNKGSSANSSRGGSKGDRGAAGGPSNDRGNSGNSSSGKSKSDRGKSGGPSNDKSNNGNNGNDRGNSGDKGNKGGNSGKSK